MGFIRNNRRIRLFSFIFILLLLFMYNLSMFSDDIPDPNIFQADEDITADALNENFNTIFNAVDGNLDNKNLKRDPDSLSKVSDGVMVSQNGNIGVGVDTPLGIIHINGSKKGTGTIFTSNTYIFGNYTAFSTELKAGDMIIADPGTGSLEMRQVLSVTDDFECLIASAFSTELPYFTQFYIAKRVIIEEISYLGINTTDPQFTLDVNGDARFTGNLNVDGKIFADVVPDGPVENADTVDP